MILEERNEPILESDQTGSVKLRASIARSITTNEDIPFSTGSKTENVVNQPSGLTRDFSEVLTNFVDEEAVPDERTEALFPEDRMNITEMLGMMLRKEEKCRKRLKLKKPLREFPKLYSPLYRGRISVWLRDFCKDHKLSMMVFFKASLFLDQFLQHENLWKKYVSTKLADDDLYAMSLVALMLASKFGSMTIAVNQIACLTGRPIKTFVLMELDMLGLVINPGFEDSSYMFNAITYNDFTWPSIRKGLENRLGEKMGAKDLDGYKTLFRRKIEFALHRAHLDRNGIANVRSSLIAIAAIDAIMLEARLKTDQRLWKLFKYDRNQPYIKKVNNMMSQALRNIDYCDIFSTYKKSWAAEDMMKNESPFQEKDVNIQQKNTISG